jgi:hypothetical protein
MWKRGPQIDSPVQFATKRRMFDYPKHGLDFLFLYTQQKSGVVPPQSKAAGRAFGGTISMRTGRHTTRGQKLGGIGRFPPNAA